MRQSSAVSQQISELEHRVGRPGLQRRPVRLTETGAVRVAAAVGIRVTLTSGGQELAALDEGTAGSIRVGDFISATEGAVPLGIARSRAHFPNIAVHLDQADPPVWYSRLLRGDLDIAPRESLGHLLGRGLHDDTAVGRPWSRRRTPTSPRDEHGSAAVPVLELNNQSWQRRIFVATVESQASSRATTTTAEKSHAALEN